MKTMFVCKRDHRFEIELNVGDANYLFNIKCKECEKLDNEIRKNKKPVKVKTEKELQRDKFNELENRVIKLELDMERFNDSKRKAERFFDNVKLLAKESDM